MRVATISETPALILYSTSACHLCDQALLLVNALQLPGLSLTIMDVSESDELFERYGLRIPVLRREDNGAELGWPFDADTVHRFLQRGS